MSTARDQPALVLYLVDGLGLSGKTKAMVDLVAGLDPARYRPRVVCFDTENEPARRAAARAGRRRSTRSPAPTASTWRWWRGSGALARRLRPEVIHCYNPRTMLYGGLVARALGVRATLGTLSAFACLTPDGDYRFLPQKLFSTSRRNRCATALACWPRCGASSPCRRRWARGFCRYNGIDASAPARRLRTASTSTASRA